MSSARRSSPVDLQAPSHWMKLGLRLLLVLGVLLGQAATQLHGYAHLADDLSRVASVDAEPGFDPEVDPGFSAEPAQGSSGHALGKCLQYHAADCAMPGVPLLQLAADDASAPAPSFLQSVQARTELRFQSRAPPVLTS
jgi:hypothetical protein